MNDDTWQVLIDLHSTLFSWLNADARTILLLAVATGMMLLGFGYAIAAPRVAGALLLACSFGFTVHAIQWWGKLTLIHVPGGDMGFGPVVTAGLVAVGIYLVARRSDSRAMRQRVPFMVLALSMALWAVAYFVQFLMGYMHDDYMVNSDPYYVVAFVPPTCMLLGTAGAFGGQLASIVMRILASTTPRQYA